MSAATPATAADEASRLADLLGSVIHVRALATVCRTIARCDDPTVMRAGLLAVADAVDPRPAIDLTRERARRRGERL